MKSMPTIAELIARSISPERKDEYTPTIDVLKAPIPVDGLNRAARFEVDVFNFLLRHKKQLGIKDVMKFTALTVDGAIELDDGRRLIVEAKLRMNWTKACQAEWQFRYFLRHRQTKAFPVQGGVFVFEELQGDGWHRQAKSRLLQDGWSQWYRAHSSVEGLQLHLLRFSQDRLESFPISDAILARFSQLPESEQKKLV